jgi:hypothetical protein
MYVQLTVFLKQLLVLQTVVKVLQVVLVTVLHKVMYVQLTVNLRQHHVQQTVLRVLVHVLVTVA